MKSLLSRCYSKAILSVTLPGLYLCTLAVVQAGARDPLFPRPARPEVDNRTELSPGYLIVYSATDTFDDGDMPYYAHSAFMNGGMKITHLISYDLGREIFSHA